VATVGIALVGAGPWGRTLARALGAIETARLRWVCERDDARRAEVGAGHPGVGLTPALDEVLADPAVSAVAVAVDSPQHHAVGLQVLAAGRHLLMEKPLALTSADAAELVATAAAGARVLTVGHLLLHHPAVRRAKQLLDDGALGTVQYLTTTRVSAGPPRAPGSAWWALAPHDVSLALHLYGATPAAVSATGGAYAAPDQDGAAFATLRFTDGRIAHVQVARYGGETQRRSVLAGTRGTLTFDERAPAQPLRLHQPGADPAVAGDVVPVELVDPLRAQCAHFIACAENGDVAGGNGAHARAVVQVLAAGEVSMRAGGAPIEVR
jgi:predicted dehydrogenase